MKKNYSLLGFLLFFHLSIYSQNSIILLDTVDLNIELNNNLNGNAIKLFDVSVDEKRGLAYISSIVNSNIPIIDLSTHKEIGSVKTPYPNDHQIHALFINEANGYIISIPNDSVNMIMYLINPSTSAVTGQFTYSTSESGIAVDTFSNNLFTGDGNELNILNGNDLSIADQPISFGYTIGGILANNHDSTLYVCSKYPSNDSIAVTVLDLLPPHHLRKKFRIYSNGHLGFTGIDNNKSVLIMSSDNESAIIDINSYTVVKTISTSDTVSDYAYSSTTHKIYMTVEKAYDDQGFGGAWSKTYIADIVTGKIDSLFDYANKVCRLAIDNNKNILVRPNQHNGMVDLIKVSPVWQVLSNVDVGESIDDFAIAPDGNTVFMAERLGGNKIIAYQKQTQTLQEFYPGNWPCIVEVDSAVSRLFVLNHYESKIKVYNAKGSFSVIDSIMLTLAGIPEGRTDAIANMYLDNETHKIYVAFPEYEKMAVVDAQTLVVDTVFSIPDFSFSNQSGIGIIQFMPVPMHHVLYVLFKNSQVLQSYDMNTMALTGSISLTNYWGTQTVQEKMMAYDKTSDRLFVGDIMLQPDIKLTLNSYIGKLNTGSSYLGYSPDHSILYTIGKINGYVAVLSHNVNSFTVMDTTFLYPENNAGFTPNYEYNHNNGDLFIAEFNQAVLKYYNMNEAVSSIHKNKSIDSDLVSIFPNPATNKIVFSLNKNRISTYTSLAIFDAYGNKIYSENIFNKEEWMVNTENYSSGIYVYKFYSTTNEICSGTFIIGK